ncbi:hypothetical protein CPB86DRAFT_803152 [Serendipita vermifera]|nr:hypothetical protein CPB86DRAFT_803152 [Serendipita vermifera]
MEPKLPPFFSNGTPSKGRPRQLRKMLPGNGRKSQTNESVIQRQSSVSEKVGKDNSSTGTKQSPDAVPTPDQGERSLIEVSAEAPNQSFPSGDTTLESPSKKVLRVPVGRLESIQTSIVNEWTKFNGRILVKLQLGFASLTRCTLPKPLIYAGQNSPMLQARHSIKVSND